MRKNLKFIINLDLKNHEALDHPSDSFSCDLRYQHVIDE